MTGDEMLREAETILKANEIKDALRRMREHLMSDIALTTKSMYDELVSVGMHEDNAHDIAKAYVLEFTRLEYEEVGCYEDDEYWDDE